MKYFMKVDKKTTVLVQHALFKMGYSWYANYQAIKYPHNQYLIVNEQLKSIHTANRTYGEVDEELKLPEGL